MEKAKEILRLTLEMGLSQREAASATRCSLGMVNAVLAKVKEAGISNPLSLETKELGSIIYPPGNGRSKAEPDFAYIDREMKKKGVTLFLLWEEYKIENPEGCMYTQFCEKYRVYRKNNSVYMRKFYKAGEKMLVDWAGLTMKYSPGKGIEKTAYVFVAVLPASSYLYSQPFSDMKMENWIEGHVNAFEYFKGVPRLVVPDNVKTAVIKASRYEPELNRTYREMAEHYGTVIVPARPNKPRDKSPVETGVQIIERRVISKLRNRRFLSLEELAEAFKEELEILNNQPFQKQPGSRRSLFLETERRELRRLPSMRYEYAQFKQAKAGFDYHVALDKNQYYSIPYQFAGQIVLVRSTLRVVEVFFNGERIACHVKNTDPRRRFITELSHMPDNHEAVSEWSPQRFISWAAKTGIRTKEYIRSLLESKDHPEQAYRTCMAILRIASTVTKERMEEACALAMAKNIYSYSYFVKLHEDLKKQEPSDFSPLIHENLRGKDYYKEAGDAR
jgi:transposase